MKSRTFIVELTESNVRYLAKAIHVILLDAPYNVGAKKALDALIQQTPIVFRLPERHGVFSALEAPQKSHSLDNVRYTPWIS